MEENEIPSLITVDEAAQATQIPATEKKRLAALVFIIGAAVVSLSLVVMIFISLLGARTGLEAIFPFLSKEPSTDLRYKN